MSTKNKGLYEIEKKINARFSSLPFERLPELASRERVKSVAVVSRGFEATTHLGHVELVTIAQAMKWL